MVQCIKTKDMAINVPISLLPPKLHIKEDMSTILNKEKVLHF